MKRKKLTLMEFKSRFINEMTDRMGENERDYAVGMAPEFYQDYLEDYKDKAEQTPEAYVIADIQTWETFLNTEERY